MKQTSILEESSIELTQKHLTIHNHSNAGEIGISSKTNNDYETVGEIVAKDIRKAAVLKKRGIDFCCGGKKTLKEACDKAGADYEEVKVELVLAETTVTNPVHDFDNWPMDFLADYIYNIHHRYIRENAGVIEELALKVATRHGHRHPELVQLGQNIKGFLADMLLHLQKEEGVVFPYIRQLVHQKNKKQGPAQGAVGSIQSPIQMMETEHEMSGEDLSYFRELTNNYHLPVNACNSHALLYHKMQEFENDLLQHIHLENNILFPKALRLENELLQILN